MDHQLLRQIISVMKTYLGKQTGFSNVFKSKRELKCQKELFLKNYFSENTSLYVFITAII